MFPLMLPIALAVWCCTAARAEQPHDRLDPEAFAEAKFLTQIDGVSPTRVAIHEDHLIFITESVHDRTLVFSVAGELVRIIEPRLAGAPDHDPTRVTLPGGQVIHTNPRTHVLQLLGADDRPRARWMRYSHRPHEGHGLLRAPDAVAVSPDGALMAVCEALEQRCQVFSLTQREDRTEPEGMQPLPPELYGPRFAIGANAIALFFPAEQKIMVVDAEPPHHMITEFGEFGTRFGQFEHITDLSLMPGDQPSEFFVAVETARSIASRWSKSIAMKRISSAWRR